MTDLTLASLLLLALLPSQAYSKECIPEQEFGLDGFVLHQDEMKIRDRLLAAPGVEILTGENSSGEYYYKRYTYKDMLVEIASNVVGRIYTEAPELPTPNGLHVGMTIEQAMTALGVETLRWNNNMREFYIESCEQKNLDILLVVTVNEKDIISAIEFVDTDP